MKSLQISAFQVSHFPVYPAFTLGTIVVLLLHLKFLHIMVLESGTASGTASGTTSGTTSGTASGTALIVLQITVLSFSLKFVKLVFSFLCYPLTY